MIHQGRPRRGRPLFSYTVTISLGNLHQIIPLMSANSSSKYEAVIGLEVHAQLQTRSKLFSGDANEFGSSPNQHVSPITLGHPGTLPKMNKMAIEYAIRMGLACHCDIAKHNFFARKNYFYPDLPKGYQISQHTTPICSGGYVEINTTEGKKKIQLTRIHLEEDAGKSIHDQHDSLTLLDYNRAGVPLIEIVTEPVIHSAEEAHSYVAEIRKMVRWIGVCDGNMEEGSLRCDANVSIRPLGSKQLGTRVEVKNLNSLKHIRHAIEIEIERLSEMMDRNEAILQETRSYDADGGFTFSIRTKEDAEDYRYFPEPDLSPFEFRDEFIQGIRTKIPSMPKQRIEEYEKKLGLSKYDATQLTEEKDLSDLFDELASKTRHWKLLANFLLGPVRSHLNQHGLEWCQLDLVNMNWNGLLELIASDKIAFSSATQHILPLMFEDINMDPNTIAIQKNLVQDADENQVAEWVKKTLDNMPEKVLEYKKGKKGLIGLFVGEVKKISGGKADPKLTTALLNQFLNKN